MAQKLYLTLANSMFRVGQYSAALEQYRKFSEQYPELARHVKWNIEKCVAGILTHSSELKVNESAPCISVIIPVHNVEEYLRQCLDSVLRQTLHNIEVIIVDDGSNDGSPAIIEEYAAQDERIIYLRNSVASGNSGTPRNQALARAKGEYVAFVDSDDWLEPGMFASLYEKAKSSDSDLVSGGGFFRENNDGTTELVNVENHVFDPTTDQRETLFLGHHFTIVWYRIYRLKLIREKGIRFGETTTSADVPFAIKTLLYTNRVTSVNEVFYHYRFNRPESTIYRRKGRGAFEIFRSYSLLLESIESDTKVQNYIPYILLKALGDYHYNQRFLAEEFLADFKAAMVSFVHKYGKGIGDHPAFNKYWRGMLKSLLSQTASFNLETLQTVNHKSRPKVSVIIPAHNVEAYIVRCLDSVLNQSLSNIEVIVINDGSTDRTLLIVEAIANSDPRVIVIDVNKGSGNPGTPRNVGLCKAQGEYIAFVDSDDWIETDMFERMVNSAVENRADIVSASGFFRHEADETKEFKIDYKTIDATARNNKDAFSSGFFSNIWNRLYRNDLIKKAGIYFPRIYLAEDFCFSALCHALAKKTALANGSFYHYTYSRPDSTTDLRTGRKGFVIVRDFDTIVSYFESFGLYEAFAAEIVGKKMNSLWYTYERLLPGLKSEFLEECRTLAVKIRQKFGASIISCDDLDRLGLTDSQFTNTH